jgi:hypothetical protein
MLRNKLGQAIAGAKMRNMKCQCGSGLKFKHQPRHDYPDQLPA